MSARETWGNRALFTLGLLADRQAWAPRIPLTVGLLAASCAAAWLWCNRGYYLLLEVERPLHPDHQSLRASGYVGLSLGILGTTLLVLNLTYLVRKRFIHTRRLGSLRAWMRLHILTGLLGPLAVLIHSAFMVRSASGSLALIAMGVVVVTGLVGRYFYGRVPRSLAGRELEYDEVLQQLRQHQRQLLLLGVDQTLLSGLAPPSTAKARDRSFLQAVACVIAGDLQLRRDVRRLCLALERTTASNDNGERIAELAQRLCRSHQWLVRYRELRHVMSSWRFLHRWLAAVMLLAAAAHIALALRFGNLWILTAT